MPAVPITTRRALHPTPVGGLAHHLPNAQLRIYPNSGHGFLDQYPTLFADHVNAFLNGG